MENNLEVRTKSGPSGISCLTAEAALSSPNGDAFNAEFACHSSVNPFKDLWGDFPQDLFDGMVKEFGKESKKNDQGRSPQASRNGIGAKADLACIPSHNSDYFQAHDSPVSTMALNPSKYNVPTAFADQRSVIVDQYQKDVKAKASQILEKNKVMIDGVQEKYKDSDGPAWKFLKEAMAKDQELGRKEYEASKEFRVQYSERINCNPYYATNSHNIYQREPELDAAKNNYIKIISSRKLLRTSYPAIVAVDVYNQGVENLFSKRIDFKASNEEIGRAMASGFEKIKDDIDKSIDKINNDDVPLETLSYVLDEVRKDPKYSEAQDEIDGWIEGEQSKDKWIKIGTAGIATVAGLGSLAFGGWPAFILAGIGTGAGAGGAIYNLERSVDLLDISQSQRVGGQLSEASYEEAKSDLVMSGVDLVLSSLDAAAVVKSLKGLSKITNASKLVEKGEEAAHLAQVEKPIAKATEELDFAEVKAKQANIEKLANRPEKEYKDVYGTKTTTGPNRIFRDATKYDAEKIDLIRKKYGAGKGKNIAHAEGEIGGEKIDLESVSGKVTPENSRHKGNFEVLGEQHYKGVLGLENHTEQKIVEHLRAKYKDTPNVSGKIEIISERPYCDNCVDIVDQFQKEFKNIEVVRVEVLK